MFRQRYHILNSNWPFKNIYKYILIDVIIIDSIGKRRVNTLQDYTDSVYINIEEKQTEML